MSQDNYSRNIDQKQALKNFKLVQTGTKIDNFGLIPLVVRTTGNDLIQINGSVATTQNVVQDDVIAILPSFAVPDINFSELPATDPEKLALIELVGSLVPGPGGVDTIAAALFYINYRGELCLKNDFSLTGTTEIYFNQLYYRNVGIGGV